MVYTALSHIFNDSLQENNKSELVGRYEVARLRYGAIPFLREYFYWPASIINRSQMDWCYIFFYPRPWKMGLFNKFMYRQNTGKYEENFYRYVTAATPCQFMYMCTIHIRALPSLGFVSDSWSPWPDWVFQELYAKCIFLHGGKQLIFGAYVGQNRSPDWHWPDKLCGFMRNM